jgi:hypothetical protein
VSVDIPHFTLPFQFSPGPGRHAVCDEQDGPDEVTHCAEAILRCPLAFRPELVDFGVTPPVFATQLDVDGMAAQIETWEPRAHVTTSEDLAQLEQLVRTVFFTTAGAA